MSAVAAIAREALHPTTMQSAVLTAPGRWTYVESRRPVPVPGEVLVRLQGCGVCSSSIPLWEGRPWFHYPAEPGAPGHEGWGIVEEVSDGVTSVARGDRVAILSYHAFAQYEAVSEAAVVRLPASLDDMPFPGEALGCAMNVWARSDIRAGQTVAIIGIGFLGAVLVRLASDAGARVLAVSRRPFSLELARAMGAAETYPIDDALTFERMQAVTAGRGCERVIEATGLQQPLDLASALVCTRGRLVIAGYHQDGPRTVDMQSWNWRGIDVVNAHERETHAYVAGMRAAVAAVAGGRLDPRPLFSHVFGFHELGEALEHTRNRPEGFVKAIVRINSTGRTP